jgi:hypothetical protein
MHYDHKYHEESPFKYLISIVPLLLTYSSDKVILESLSRGKQSSIFGPNMRKNPTFVILYLFDFKFYFINIAYIYIKLPE